MIYFVVFVLIYLLKVLLKLNIWVCLMLGIYGFMMVPLYRKRARKIREFRQHFYEVSLYLDTILYAFVKEEKVRAQMAENAKKPAKKGWWAQKLEEAQSQSKIRTNKQNQENSI